jgi:hypothetical protein
LSLSSDFLVSKFAFKCNLYRYSMSDKERKAWNWGHGGDGGGGGGNGEVEVEVQVANLHPYAQQQQQQQYYRPSTSGDIGGGGVHRGGRTSMRAGADGGAGDARRPGTSAGRVESGGRDGGGGLDGDGDSEILFFDEGVSERPPPPGASSPPWSTKSSVRRKAPYKEPEAGLRKLDAFLKLHQMKLNQMSP